MSITSFDHFIETLEHVPPELQRNFTMIADLDHKTEDVIRRVHECVQEYRKSDKHDERLALYRESMDLFDRARGYADDKVDLAIQTYDLIDKHIRRLENLGGQTASAQTESSTNRASSSGRKQKDGKQNGDNQDAIHGTEPLAVDMPLDPNEPRYCTCQQVSFGEMIACDNKDCPIEWFHFACVNLKVKPKGKWYCPECFNTNRKGKLKFKRQKV